MSCCLKCIPDFRIQSSMPQVFLDSHNIIKTLGWVRIRALLNFQPFSPCFQLAIVSSQAQHNGWWAKFYNLVTSSPNSTAAGCFSRTAFLSQGLSSDLSPLLHWVLQHILLGHLWRLCRTLLQSLPSAALLWQPSAQPSLSPLQHNDLVLIWGPWQPPCSAVVGQHSSLANSSLWHSNTLARFAEDHLPAFSPAPC